MGPHATGEHFYLFVNCSHVTVFIFFIFLFFLFFFFIILCILSCLFLFFFQLFSRVRCFGNVDPAYPIPTGLASDGVTPVPLRWLSVAVLDFQVCGLLLDGTMRCWGPNGWNIIPFQPADPSRKFSQIVSGALHVCALTAPSATETEPQLFCFGADQDRIIPPPPLPVDMVPHRLKKGFVSGVLLMRNRTDQSERPKMFAKVWGTGASGREKTTKEAEVEGEWDSPGNYHV